MSPSPPENTYTVGYALNPTKVDSFIQPSLLSHAKSRGIDFVPIDITKPLIEQGPFHVIAHKLYDEEWKKTLSGFSAANPDVLIIDDHESIERLHNRVTMLEAVNNLQIGGHEETLGVPKQIVVDEIDSNADLGMRFPVIAKPVMANGTAKSHTMSLIFNANGLRDLQPPVVLQEFVNHGGVVFKVYVAGELVRCVKRRSLPDVSEEQSGDSMTFAQISNLNGEEESHDYGKNILEAEMPPSSFVSDVAHGLRKALKLHLFNFDMIRDSSDRNRYFVIDINYFPGYAKMPKYETMLTDFFLGIVRREGSCGELEMRIDSIHWRGLV